MPSDPLIDAAATIVNPPPVAGAQPGSVATAELGRALLLAQQVASETIAEAQRQAAAIVAAAETSSEPTHAAPQPVDEHVLERLADAFADLERSLSDDLEDVARRLDAVRIQTGARVALLLAELDRLRGGPVTPE